MSPDFARWMLLRDRDRVRGAMVRDRALQCRVRGVSPRAPSIASSASAIARKLRTRSGWQQQGGGVSRLKSPVPV